MKNVREDKGNRSCISTILTELDVLSNRDIQVSVFDGEPSLIYHDWQGHRGAQVSFPGPKGHMVLDEIFLYPEGAVAWIDQSTNAPRPLTVNYRRLNIALFTTTVRPGWRIVVEVHQEVE